MPQSTLSLSRVQAMLPEPLPTERWEELLFASKAELVGIDGDELQISATPDRLDLLSEGGLGLYLEGITGSRTGLPHIRRAAGPGPTIEVAATVHPLRPEIAGVLVYPPKGSGIDEGTLAEAIRFQEVIHASVGRDRRKASLGLYALDRIRFPLWYALEPMESVRFTPLDRNRAISASEFFEEHPMATRYGAFGRAGNACLVLRDASDAVASLPPILNGRESGEVRPGDRGLLLESTGTSARAVRESLQLLLLVFVARGWSVEPVRIEPSSATPETEAPVFSPRKIELRTSDLLGIAGERIAGPEVRRLARSCRMDVRASAGGWTITAAPWRIDLLGSVDVTEDLVIARGLSTSGTLLPLSSTLGRRRPESVFRRRFSPILLGAGLMSLYTPVVVSDGAVERSERSPDTIRLANPPSQEFAALRSSLAISLLESLRHNVRHSYPQRISETGPVVVQSTKGESGTETRYHIGFALAGEGLGFADAAALIDYLLRTVDVTGVREPAEIPATIPGRAARVRLAGEGIAEVGEFHPRVLEAAGIPVPVAWGELDLSALWPLVRRPGTV